MTIQNDNFSDELIPDIETTINSRSNGLNQAFQNLLSENLPIVGTLYNGDLIDAAKKLEMAIGKEINIPMSGMIWNDQKKQFNTTPDDIRKSLDIIQMHKSPKSIQSSRNDRINIMSNFSK